MNEIVQIEKPKTIIQMIEEKVDDLGKSLPNDMDAQRMVKIVTMCIRRNPELSTCTPNSLIGAMFMSAQLGIEPQAGLAYLIPFNNSKKIGNTWKKIKEVQFILGYRGIVQLFYRHAKAVSISWGVVKENDEFDYKRGTNAFLDHKEAEGDRGDNVGYWVLARLLNGGEVFEYMTHNQCMEHGRSHSKTFDKRKFKFYDSSPWHTNPESMCLKTVVVRLSKLLPMSVDMHQAIQADESSRHFVENTADIVGLPDQTSWDNDDASEISEEMDK